MQNMTKCGRRVEPERAPVQEEQDMVHHSLLIPDIEESPGVTWMTQEEMFRSLWVYFPWL